MKRIIVALVLISIILAIGIYSVDRYKNNPQISVKFNVSNLTDEEFMYVGTKRLDNPTKNDFKNIEFTLDVKNSDAISNRKITVPDLKAVVSSYDKNRYWFGNYGSDDSPVNKYAQYDSKFVIYSNGLTDQDIKNIFNSSEVKISWTTSDCKDEEKIINLGDIIEFE
jgi:hypothetical protein